MLFFKISVGVIEDSGCLFVVIVFVLLLISLKVLGMLGLVEKLFILLFISMFVFLVIRFEL